MVSVKFTDFVRSFSIQLTEDAVKAIYNGAGLFSVLTREQVSDIEKGLTNPYNGIRSKWSGIVAKANGTYIWAGDTTLPACAAVKGVRF